MLNINILGDGGSRNDVYQPVSNHVAEDIACQATTAMLTFLAAERAVIGGG